MTKSSGSLTCQPAIDHDVCHAVTSKSVGTVQSTCHLITIPCHEAAGNIIADIANKDNRDPKDDPKGDLKELTDRQRIIIEMIIADPFLSAKAISEKISEKTSEKIRVTARTIESDLAQLKRLGVLTREGGRKEGKWVIRIEK